MSQQARNLQDRVTKAVQNGDVSEAKPLIHIENVTKAFGEFVAVNDASLTIYEGELFSLLGGSGCGKTTLLRMLAGFEMPTAGRILIDGQNMMNVPPYERPVNMMFQSYALFPHMTVEQNVAFGLKQDGLPRAVVREQVAEMLSLVELRGYEKRRPHELSGGQRQRVALARALAKRPKVLLLDEPLGALDKKLRERTQIELVNIQENLGVTFVVVTHDQGEAMTMSTRVAVMYQGRILQVDTPHAVYEFPNTRYVAEFFGDVNMFEGTLVEDAGGRSLIECEDLPVPIYVKRGIASFVGATLFAAVRPEKIWITTTEPADSTCNMAVGEIEDIVYLGNESIYLIRLDGGRLIRVVTQNLTRVVEPGYTWEDRVYVSWRGENVVVVTS